MEMDTKNICIALNCEKFEDNIDPENVIHTRN